MEGVDELRFLEGGRGEEVRSGESSIHTRTVGKQYQKNERYIGKGKIIYLVGLCIKFGEEGYIPSFEPLGSGALRHD